MSPIGEVDQRVLEFANVVGASDPVTVVGGRTQWAVGGTTEPVSYTHLRAHET